MENEKNPVDVYVGNRLNFRRTMLGLSQAKIGEMIGVTYQQIQKYEKGINRMGSGRLYEIAKILLVPISYFFDGYEEEAVYPSEEAENFVAHNVNNKEINSLVKNFIKIGNAEVRKSFIRFVKDMAHHAAGIGKGVSDE